MAKSVLELAVDAGQWDSGLKKAQTALQRFTECHKDAKDGMSEASQKMQQFIKMMGDMESTASTARGKMREYTNTIANLTMEYENLSAADKAGEMGRAYAEAMDKLKVKAGQLRDQMDDLNEELKHIASDTQFSDGMRLMTSTVGACASAVVAWSGDGKKMEEVIKDLAKVQTTVAAVEALTKAFQKQNLVLLKNPYVAAAAAIAAVGVAIYEVVKKTQELDRVTKALNEVQAKGRENAAQEVMRISALNDILHDNTRSLDERKDALDAIQNLVPEYHGALDTEGNLINDNTTALDDYITNLQRAATAQAAFDRMVELQKQKLAKQLELADAQTALAERKAETRAAYSLNDRDAAGNKKASVALKRDAAMNAERRASNKVESINTDIADIDREIQALQGLADANTIAGNAAEKRTTTTKTATKTEREVLDIIQQRAKRIADVEAAMELLRNTLATTEDANLKAWGTQELEKYQAQLDALNGVIKEVPAEVEKIPTAMERAASALAAAKSAYLKGETGKDPYADANAAMNLQGLVDKNALEGINIPIGVEVTDEEWQALVDKINEQLAALDLPPIELDVKTGNIKGVTEEVKATKSAWSDAASAISSVGSAMSAIEDPAAKVVGIVAQAIAQVAAGYGAALAKAGATGDAGGPWGWVAFAATGAAAMVSSIAAIKAATEYHAGGGFVGGGPRGTDTVNTWLTPGELVLNRAQQNSLAGQLVGSANKPYNIVVTGKISGRDIRLAADTDNRSRGGSRGAYANIK